MTDLTQKTTQELTEDLKALKELFTTCNLEERAEELGKLLKATKEELKNRS